MTSTGAWGAEGERPRRVLMVHSFGGSTFATHSTAFESAIKRELGAAVDLDQVSLENARYAEPGVEEAFAERSASHRRHPGHGDEPEDAAEVREDVEAGRYDPLDVPGELIRIDPDEVDLDDLATRAAPSEAASALQ